MLRQMVFKNFIHFEDFQYLTFKDGPHFFIGANSTGKTSVLEILRRCMSTDINSTISSSYDNTKNAYAFCQFEISTLIKNIKIVENISSICSGVVKIRDKYFLKIVGLQSRKSPSTLIQAIYYNIDENDKIIEEYQKTVNAEKSFEDRKLTSTLASLLSTTSQTEMSLSKFSANKDVLLTFLLKSIYNLSPVTDEELQANWTPDAEKFRLNLKKMRFIQHVESTYVATMPMRAIGPLQWTKSKNIHQKEKNYQKACKKAEIINALLTSDKVDKEKADSIFNFLTYPFEYEFTKKQENEMFVQEKHSAKFHILKSPEGIIEAKQFSLIMAHKVFHTICLEEPDRCMHPQMVERMRDIFQKEKIHTDKVVIVITHNPFLINSITAEHTHVFFRKSQLMLSKCPFGIRAINDINRHITDIDNLKKLIFAAKVLCMEGTTDKIVIEGLFDHIFKFTDKDESVKQSIVSHQLVVLGSKTFDSPVKKFCTQTNLPAKWVFDRDKYIQMNGIKIAEVDADGDYSQFKGATIDEFLQNVNGFQKLSKELSDKGIFIWKWGDLEDTIIYSLTDEQKKNIFRMKESESRKQKKSIKKKLSSIARDNLASLARCMHEDSERPNEVERFLEFLQRETG